MKNTLSSKSSLHQQMQEVKQRSLDFLQAHATGNEHVDRDLLSGEFSLLCNRNEPDLYGMLDAAYILFTLGELAPRTSRASRQQWAARILSCQGDEGWFSRRNLRGHSREHATAYALGALMLLAIEPDELYVDQVKPLAFLLPLLEDRDASERWIHRLDFRPTLQSIRRKKLGWHYIWRGSHVGGGIAAVIGMTQHLFGEWWSLPQAGQSWLSWYIEWLNANANPRTGYWQRAFWNTVYKKPTLIDMGGAVHFYWVYEAMNEQFPYPHRIIATTTSLQKPNGLYKDHPFCIDLDGNFCIIRAYLQLPQTERLALKEVVYTAAEANFNGVLQHLVERPFEKIYTDSHGLPGALCALIECTKLPSFKHAPLMSHWQNPLDTAWWL